MIWILPNKTPNLARGTWGRRCPWHMAKPGAGPGRLPPPPPPPSAHRGLGHFWASTINEQQHSLSPSAEWQGKGNPDVFHWAGSLFREPQGSTLHCMLILNTLMQKKLQLLLKLKGWLTFFLESPRVEGKRLQLLHLLKSPWVPLSQGDGGMVEHRTKSQIGEADRVS